MIHDLKGTQIVDKVGGRFKLSALIQKRILELMQGSRPLIDNPQGKTMIEIAVAEIIQDKITCDFDSGPAKPAPALKKF
jgi:DNA-directed RNA polymerase subunit omega